MKIGWLAPVVVAMAILPGCKSRSQSSAYNPRYDGLSGQAIPPVNLNILKNQAALAEKYAANTGTVNNTENSTVTPTKQP